MDSKGYLRTNIFDIEKSFPLGIEKVNSFMEAYFEIAVGHEIVYIDNSSSNNSSNNSTMMSGEYIPNS